MLRGFDREAHVAQHDARARAERHLHVFQLTTRESRRQAHGCSGLDHWRRQVREGIQTDGRCSHPLLGDRRARQHAQHIEQGQRQQRGHCQPDRREASIKNSGSRQVEASHHGYALHSRHQRSGQPEPESLAAPEASDLLVYCGQLLDSSILRAKCLDVRCRRKGCHQGG